MSELRRDPIVGRWVIIDTDHPAEPGDFEKETSKPATGECPFCSGQENKTPPEIEAVRVAGTSPNTGGWQVRVVPNKFPALRIEGELERQGVGIYDMSNGVGAHEVIIETPDHNKNITDLSDTEVENIVRMYCRRSLDLHNDKRFKYIMIFKNFGFSAGASLEHPHSQLIALPMVPKNVHEEIKGALDYFKYRDRCVFCDILHQEKDEKERIVCESKYFVSFCPFVSRFPFEVWIVPKRHSHWYCQMVKEEFLDLARVLKETLLRIKLVLDNPAYNYIIHTAPFDGQSFEGYHWHIEIMPKLTRVAGFEWGSGFYIVPTTPELAAGYLKNAKIG